MIVTAPLPAKPEGVAAHTDGYWLVHCYHYEYTPGYGYNGSFNCVVRVGQDGGVTELTRWDVAGEQSSLILIDERTGEPVWHRPVERLSAEDPVPGWPPPGRRERDYAERNTQNSVIGSKAVITASHLRCILTNCRSDTPMLVAFLRPEFLGAVETAPPNDKTFSVIDRAGYTHYAIPTDDPDEKVVGVCLARDACTALVLSNKRAFIFDV